MIDWIRHSSAQTRYAYQQRVPGPLHFDGHGLFNSSNPDKFVAEKDVAAAVRTRVDDALRVNDSDPVERSDMVVQLRAMVERLPPRHQAVLSLRYERDMTLADVGKVLGVTESRVCQIERAALDILRRRKATALKYKKPKRPETVRVSARSTPIPAPEIVPPPKPPGPAPEWRARNPKERTAPDREWTRREQRKSAISKQRLEWLRRGPATKPGP